MVPFLSLVQMMDRRSNLFMEQQNVKKSEIIMKQKIKSTLVHYWTISIVNQCNANVMQ